MQPWNWQPIAPGTALPAPGPTLAAEPSSTVALGSQATPPKTSTASRPTATSTRVTTPLPSPDPAELASQAGTAQAQETQVLEQVQASMDQIRWRAVQRGTPLDYNRNSRLVLAHYFAWYGGYVWDDCNISAGDKPLQPYDSNNPADITRHIFMARDIGLNGFLVHWFGPDNPTDYNFKTLLQLSEGQPFASTVVFSRHIWNGGPVDQTTITEALRYIIQTHGAHPNFLRLEGKPVIFFTDVYRTPSQNPHQFWATVRDQLDPQRESWWIAEGLDASYLTVFDGLYVFKVSHAAYPHDYLKSSRWAGRVRAMAGRVGQPKLWLATISPGWDDLRSGCRPDVRVDNTSHRLDRAGGEVYRANFAAALESQPEWLLIGSFNEWVEGTYIEPSVQYGDQYMRMTQEFIQQFQGNGP